MDDSQNVDI